jgi:cytochrome c nitrite reductase small subunit
MTPARSFSIAAIFLCILAGVLVGLSAFTFHTAQGASYLSNDPAACVNCHIMRDQHDSWQKSSHHAFAVCNDCHVPQDFFGKYWTKAEHGVRHSWGFTFQDFHEPIQMKASSRAAVQSNCQRCHADFTSQIAAHEDVPSQATDCIRCHQSVGHGANH